MDFINAIILIGLAFSVIYLVRHLKVKGDKARASLSNMYLSSLFNACFKAIGKEWDDNVTEDPASIPLDPEYQDLLNYFGVYVSNWGRLVTTSDSYCRADSRLILTQVSHYATVDSKDQGIPYYIIKVGVSIDQEIHHYLVGVRSDSVADAVDAVNVHLNTVTVILNRFNMSHDLKVPTVFNI